MLRPHLGKKSSAPKSTQPLFSLCPPPPSLFNKPPPLPPPLLSLSISPTLPPLLSRLSNNKGMEALIESADLSWMQSVRPPNVPRGKGDQLPDQILPKFKTAIISN